MKGANEQKKKRQKKRKRGICLEWRKRATEARETRELQREHQKKKKKTTPTHLEMG